MPALAAVIFITGLGLTSCAPPIQTDERDRPFLDQVGSPRADEASRARQQIAALHPEWPPEVRQAVTSGEVFEGMSPQVVVATWGLPSQSGRPWLLTTGRPEFWWRYGRTNPAIQVWFEYSKVKFVSYDESAVPDPPRGEHGYKLESLAR